MSKSGIPRLDISPPHLAQCCWVAHGTRRYSRSPHSSHCGEAVGSLVSGAGGAIATALSEGASAGAAGGRCSTERCGGTGVAASISPSMAPAAVSASLVTQSGEDGGCGDGRVDLDERVSETMDDVLLLVLRAERSDLLS